MRAGSQEDKDIYDDQSGPVSPRVTEWGVFHGEHSHPVRDLRRGLAACQPPWGTTSRR